MSLSTTPGSAANVIVKDGNTIQLAEITYRLDGIDAPELDQICIDDHADPWTCGVDARNQLARQVGGHMVRCEDHGPDPVYSKRHLGICTVEGEMASLNQLAIGQGFAMNSARGRLRRLMRPLPRPIARESGKAVLSRRPNSASARKTARCSVVPALPTRIVRYARCCSRNTPAMPPRCTIKAKFAVRARVTGHIGIYHLQGCRSYPALTRPDRWFCTEDDAQAAGFPRL